VTSADKFEPLTVKDCEADGVPCVAVKAGSKPTLVNTVGPDGPLPGVQSRKTLPPASVRRLNDP